MATCRHMVLSSLDFTPLIKRSRTASTNRGMHCISSCMTGRMYGLMYSLASQKRKKEHEM
ncbi:hypothetical protein EYF80_042108 [Liparis tanakae]|uniref:Uncharacterized protein n=1 Tax=Liparis tanakae TaxID=230148 RepID=A0A4Z2G2A5_9TELE|nr:hypothetical protein EYF80_042108 [Liparis tanakae]